MMWLYQILDIVSTLTEAMALYIFSLCFCKERRYSKTTCSLGIIGGYFTAVYLMTWFTDLGGLKMPFVFFISLILAKICYRDSILQCIVSYESSIIGTSMLSEGIGIFIGNIIYHDNMLVMIDGNSLFRWEIYIITLIIRILTFSAVYVLCRNFRYKITVKDLVVVTAIFFIIYLEFMYDTFIHLNLNDTRNVASYIFQAVIPILFIILFMYVKNTMFLREEKQRDEIQILQLEKEYEYYQDKLRDEERIRSIYHDMKNHLLVLEKSRTSDETIAMAQKLRMQIADYENYIHTGNSFLDIIIRDKAEKARERNIDFSADIDFEDVDFIEPLDISTLFGNGLDNAIEACEKLDDENRVITVKAGKMHEFVSVMIENSCIDGKQLGKRSTKGDDFLHGFGIPNMEKTAEKYKGTCTVKNENGKFTLKILLPVPEEREDL